MITFESQEAFENAVIEAMRKRVAVGVTVSKKSGWGESATKVEVSLFDSKDGIDIDRGSDYE